MAQPGPSTQTRDPGVRARASELFYAAHAPARTSPAAGELFLRPRPRRAAAADRARPVKDLEEGLPVGSVVSGSTAGAGWPGRPASSSLRRARPGIELTVSTFGGALLRGALRIARLDAMIAPSEFGSAELRRVRLGRDAALVLAGRSPVPGRCAVAAPELEGRAVRRHRASRRRRL